MHSWKSRSEPAAWLEQVASGTLGMSVGIAAWWPLDGLSIASRFIAAAAAAVAAFAVAFIVLARISAPREHHLAQFELVDLEPIATAILLPQAELLLRLEDRLGLSIDSSGAQELLLDDPLELPDNSRVVQLFKTAPLPTAGELQQRIDRHLAAGTPALAAPDASEELYDALAALRQSLR